MTAVDTNVLVRIITNDDRTEAVRAAAFLRGQERVFIAKTVLLELEWVLRSAYRIEQAEIFSALRRITEIANAEIEDEAVVLQAMEWFGKGMDFADALHLASAGSDNEFATFDRGLRRKALRLHLPKVVFV